MDPDDLPKPAGETMFPRDLEKLSVAELQDYVQELKDELKRVEADIAAKQAQKDAADSVFGN